MRDHSAIGPGLIQEMAFVAAQADAWDRAVQALTRAVDGAANLAPRHAFELHRVLVIWNRDRRGDLAAAEASIVKALACNPTDLDMLRALASMQRGRPGRALYDTLRRLADASPRDLDVLDEAARLAIDHLDEPAERLTALSALLTRASAAWRGTSDAEGLLEPSVYVRWCMEQLVERYRAAGQPGGAVDLLVEGSRLPFDADARRAMRHRAAEIAFGDMGDKGVAIEMYRSVLSQAPDDTRAMQRLAELFESEGRLAENLALKRVQLSVEKSTERRLGLRLEIA